MVHMSVLVFKVGILLDIILCCG